METLEKGGLILKKHALTRDSSSSPFMLRNQIDARSHLQIASADHFAREMGHMAECVLRDQKPCTPGEERLRDMILMDATTGRRKTVDRYLYDVDTAAAVTIFAGLR